VLVAIGQCQQHVEDGWRQRLIGGHRQRRS
jgi:hypothetical protein